MTTETLPPQTGAKFAFAQKFFRRRYLVNPKFQLRYAFLFFAVGALVATFVGLIAFFSLREAYQAFLNAHFHQPPELILALEHKLRFLTRVLIGTLTFLALFCLGFGIFVTHRIVGPLMRLREAMEKVAAGDTSQKLQFRPKDDFQELAVSFNALVDGIRERK